MDNPWARPYLCPVCRDTRMVTASVRAREGDVSPCPKCGADPHKGEPESRESSNRHEDFVHRRYTEVSKPPNLCEVDLTPEEFKTYQRLRDENPKVSKLTVLSWTEGGRYHPEKDPEFMAEAREAFKKWRADRDAAYKEYRETHAYSKGDGRIGKEIL